MGYKGLKHALPVLRVRLQFLTYLKIKKLIWDLRKNIVINKDFLNADEIKFLLKLDKSVTKRKNKFNVLDKKKIIALLNKIHKEIMVLLNV